MSDKKQSAGKGGLSVSPTIPGGGGWGVVVIMFFLSESYGYILCFNQNITVNISSIAG